MSKSQCKSLTCLRRTEKAYTIQLEISCSNCWVYRIKGRKCSTKTPMYTYVPEGPILFLFVSTIYWWMQWLKLCSGPLGELTPNVLEPNQSSSIALVLIIFLLARDIYFTWVMLRSGKKIRSKIKISHQGSRYNLGTRREQSFHEKWFHRLRSNFPQDYEVLSLFVSPVVQSNIPWCPQSFLFLS